MEADDRLRPYVAGLVVDWLQTSPEVRHRSLEGSLAFVDISGFTTLTERLATKGKVGAEEMSDVLDASFSTLLEVAYSYGALLVKWGGDAVLLLFEGPEHAALACRAAHEMRRTMRRIGRLRTSVGAITLRMSVGVHSGSFDFFLAGRRHHELLVSGPAATTTATMEADADAGEIVVSPQTAGLLPARCLGEAKGGGVLLRSAPDVDQRSRVWPRHPEPFDVGACLDPAIRDHLLAEVGDSEHRQIAVGFVEVRAVDELLLRQGPGAVASALHELVALVQEQCARHRVTFWETDIAKDGFKIMLVAGAPRGTGHDEDGMLRAARAILDGHRGPIRVRIGINCGRVFSGGFGPSFRRTWSVKGDAVNLAARVMGKAEPGQLLTTELLLQRVGSAVVTEPLPPFLVKGKRHPVRAALVRQVDALRVADATQPAAFVGRTGELARLDVVAAELARGRGRAIAVLGPAGIGKSRLVDHVCHRLGGEDVRVLRGFADAYESATPYFAVRRLLRSALGADGEDDAVLDALRHRLGSQAPHLLPWLPMLAAPLGVRLPDTTQTAAVADQFRRARVCALVLELLGLLSPGRTVLVVEDVHSADDASLELLTALAQGATGRPWLLLLVGRHAPAALAPGEVVEELLVPPLDEHEGRELVLSAADGSQLAPHVVRVVVARAEGNPMFLQQLADAARRHEGGELPSSLEELLAAQLDDLAPEHRRLLRVVSVLGVRFEESLAAELAGASAAPAWTQLVSFLAADGAGRRRFRSGLVRDAAYEGLPFRRRSELHGRAAQLIEARAGRRRADLAESLSLHNLAAQRFQAAWDYSRIAAERAQRAYANVEAVVLHRRALQAARGLPSLPPSAVAAVLEQLADVQARLAELDDAAASYRAARRRVPATDPVGRARLSLGVALVTGRSGSATASLRWLTTAERELAGDAALAPAAAELHARVLVERAFLRHVQGRASDAERLCRRAVEAATAAGADDALGRALQLLDMVELAAGGPGDEARVQHALRLFERCGDLPRQAGAWNHLGIRAYYEGAWELAVQRYEWARSVHERSGDDWSAAITSANLAEILVDQGRLAEAEPLIASALRVWRVAGTPSDIGFDAALLGRLLCRDGRMPEGLALLSEAAEAYASTDERFDLLDTQLRVVEALLLQGSSAAALDRLTDAEQALREAARTAGLVPAGEAPLPSAVPHVGAVLRYRGIGLAQQGHDVAAGEQLRRALSTARERASVHEVVLALDALVRFTGRTGRPGAEAAERDELMQRLGIVRLPAFPLRARPSTPGVVSIARQRTARDAVV